MSALKMVTYRLDHETLAQIDALAAALAAPTASPPNKAAALRYAVRVATAQLASSQADPAGKKTSRKARLSA